MMYLLLMVMSSVSASRVEALGAIMVLREEPSLDVNFEQRFAL